MNSPNVTTVPLPPAKGRSIGRIRADQALGLRSRGPDAASKLGKIQSPQMGRIHWPLRMIDFRIISPHQNFCNVSPPNWSVNGRGPSPSVTRTASDHISVGSLRPPYSELIGCTKRNDQLGIVFIVGDNNFPFVRIIVAYMLQYLIDKIPPVFIGFVQRVKLLSVVVADAGSLGL